MTIEERFWSKVDRRGPDECWPWTSTKARRYGIFRFDWRERRMRRAHRVAWEFSLGPIPDGMVVMHICDNPPCCNPTHLRLGTQLENIADRDRKGRTAHNSGERCGHAKITRQVAAEIRAAYRGRGDQPRLAAAFGVHRTTISRVVNGEAWA